MRFYLVDRVDEIVPGEFARGIKNITLSEDFLAEHFPGRPIFPGTLVVEAMAQLGGFLVEVSANCSEEPIRRAMLVQIDKAKFHAPCLPGDQVQLDCRLDSSFPGAARILGEARVGEKKVASVALTFMLRSIDEERVHGDRREVYRTWTRHLKLPFEIL
jgi:3-hydroxyacyl-[acyl-carrier-protein] dehydratase